MSMFALLVIAGLVTTLLVKTRKAAPALLAGVVTVCLLFATFPGLGPAVTAGAGAFAHQLGAATDRAADLPTSDRTGDDR